MSSCSTKELWEEYKVKGIILTRETLSQVRDDIVLVVLEPWGVLRDLLRC
jgi:hypothetical protein